MNALDQKKRVGKAGKATVIHHVVTKTKKRVRHTLIWSVDLKFRISTLKSRVKITNWIYYLELS